jgi:hypothetical protein
LKLFSLAVREANLISITCLTKWKRCHRNSCNKSDCKAALQLVHADQNFTAFYASDIRHADGRLFVLKGHGFSRAVSSLK